MACRQGINLQVGVTIKRESLRALVRKRPTKDAILAAKADIAENKQMLIEHESWCTECETSLVQ